jgi:signal transduction histidine kinase
LVRHIALAHGGRVAVESGVDKGSTFTVTIPVPEEPPPDEAEAAS